MIRVAASAARRYLLDRLGVGSGDPWRASLQGVDGVRAALARLECVQIDPVNVLARNQSLAVAQRVTQPGSGLDGLLAGREIFEYVCAARYAYPIADYPYFAARMRHNARRWAPELEKLGASVSTVIARLEREGPLPSRSLDTGQRVSGFWDGDGVDRTKATRFALDLLESAGVVTTARREGQERHFALAEQIIPADLRAAGEAMGDRECRDYIIEKYFRAHVIAFSTDFRFGWVRPPAAEKRQLLADWVASGKLVEVAIEGVKRPYYALAADAERLQTVSAVSAEDETGGRVFILPPLDNLLYQRERLADLFGFAYTWEVYVPPAKRRYGPYTMPILAGERLIGRIDARLDRQNSKLVINLLEYEPWLRPKADLKRRVKLAVEALAREVGARDLENGNPERVAMKID